MSSEATLVLSCAIIYFEMLIMEWEKMGEQYEELKPWMDIGLHWAMKYYIQMDNTDAYIITMCKSSS
jgi:hypothetical protein